MNSWFLWYVWVNTFPHASPMDPIGQYQLLMLNIIRMYGLSVNFLKCHFANLLTTSWRLLLTKHHETPQLGASTKWGGQFTSRIRDIHAETIWNLLTLEKNPWCIPGYLWTTMNGFIEIVEIVWNIHFRIPKNETFTFSDEQKYPYKPLTHQTTSNQVLLFRVVRPVRSKTLPGVRVTRRSFWAHQGTYFSLVKGTWENPRSFCLGKSCGVGETVWNLIRWMKHHIFFVDFIKVLVFIISTRFHKFQCH